MHDRDLNTREIVQLVERLRARIRGIDTTARRDLDYELHRAHEWYGRGDPVRAGLALAAADEFGEAIADLPDARELLGFLLHETGWPRPLRIQYMSDLHARQPDQLAIADTGADVLVVPVTSRTPGKGCAGSSRRRAPRTWFSRPATTTRSARTTTSTARRSG